MSVPDGREAEESAPQPQAPAGWRARGRARWPFWPVAVVLIVGLVATGVLTWASYTSYQHNEARLLRLRARDIGTILTSVLPGVQTPLASGAALADATDGNVQKFRRFMAPYVGKGRSFVSVSFWRAKHPLHGPVTVVGLRPVLAKWTAPPKAAFIIHAARAPNLTVIGLLKANRLGYGFSGQGTGPYVAYGESAIPPGRFEAVKGTSFSDLNFAVYLGSRPNSSDLLLASTLHLPLTGQVYTTRVPFGNRSVTMVVGERQSLAGTLLKRLPLIIAIVGTLLTLAAAALAIRLIARRRIVERLADRLEQVADENRRLYAEQRTIAQTLQHALLPEVLPQFPGLQVSARYEAGAEGVEIGGDWYDLIALHDERLLLVVGDVSGRGLRAATTMALLRFAIHAYHAQGDEPSTFLPKLSGLVSVVTDGQLATVLCISIDVRRREISVTNAGHLPPLLLSADGSEFIETQVGLPVGVDRDATYSSSTLVAPPGATLLAYTDGLVERRGESIEVGLERLRTRAQSNHVGLEQLVTRVVEEMRDESKDDTAVAAIRWTQ